jgi:ADP-heptose:LPS heptosyltransferase
MQIQFMQSVDFWAGVPLCWICSLLHWLRSWIAPRPASIPKKVLFIELSEMGSAIIAYSALKRARERYGDQIYFLIFDKNAESVALTGIIAEDHILKVDDSSFFNFVRSLLSQLWRIHKIGIDTVIDMELFSRCTALISFAVGAAHRVGFHRHTNEGLYRGNFFSYRVLYNPHQHMSLNFLALVLALEAPTDEYPMLKRNVREDLVPLPKIQLSELERSIVWGKLTSLAPQLTNESKIVVLNPDPGVLPLRGWGLDRYVEVATQLAKRHAEVTMVVTGLPRSKSWAEAVQNAVGRNRCVDMTGMTETVREVVVLLSFARLLLTNDSGPAHLAALTSCQIVVLFGPETPALYAPLGDQVQSIYAGLSCSPCYAASNHRRTHCTDNKCMQSIEVSEVMRAVNRAIQ